jgi:outer membrane protein assembly factor BamC
LNRFTAWFIGEFRKQRVKFVMKHDCGFFVILALVVLGGCNFLPSLDDVMPDKRTEYKKSDSLPELEVPPDLTSQTINDSMAIPNEPATLSRMQQQRAADAAPVTASPGEQWVAVRQSRADMWPKLRDYFSRKGYPIEVDDAELGVLETGWGAPQAVGATQRLKFRVFSEPGATPDVTVLFISSQRQVVGKNADGGTQWVDQEGDGAADKLVAGDLNQLLNGGGAAPVAAAGSAEPAATGAASAAADAPASGKPLAEIRDAGDGRILLALPDEYSIAWPRTDKALQRGGFFIEGKDEAKGLYRISYFKASEEEKKSWLSKMKFWGDDETEGQAYQISLTGVGRKTEMIVMNDDGEWDSSEDARRILTIVQSNYGL